MSRLPTSLLHMCAKFGEDRSNISCSTGCRAEHTISGLGKIGKKPEVIKIVETTSLFEQGIMGLPTSYSCAAVAQLLRSLVPQTQDVCRMPRAMSK